MAVARQIEIHAEEDGVVAVQRDTIVDPERGLVAEVEKVVVAVDAGEGKVAVMEQERVKAIRAIPIPVPMYTQDQPSPATTSPATTYKPGPRSLSATRSSNRTPRLQSTATRHNNTNTGLDNTGSRQICMTTLPATTYKPGPRSLSATRSSNRIPLLQSTATRHDNTSTALDNIRDKASCIYDDMESRRNYMFCGCGCVFLIGGVLLIGLAAGLLLPCGPLHYASIPFIAFGCLICLVGGICCVFICEMIKGKGAVFCSICVGIIVALMIIIIAFSEWGFLIADYSQLMSNGTYIDGCKDKAIPIALTILSFVFFVPTCCFCLGTCINSVIWLYRNCA